MAQRATVVQCPVCSKSFVNWMIGGHVEECLSKPNEEHKKTKPTEKIKDRNSNNANEQMAKNSVTSPKTKNSGFISTMISPPTKKAKFEKMGPQTENKSNKPARFMPLAEKVRPQSLKEYVGQAEVVGNKSFLKNLLVTDDQVPSMIFWGPPGCGKVTC